jgi:hypothetical protein
MLGQLVQALQELLQTHSRLRFGRLDEVSHIETHKLTPAQRASETQQ